MDPREATVDKIVFRVERDCRYSDADRWPERVGQRQGFQQMQKREEIHKGHGT